MTKSYALEITYWPSRSETMNEIEESRDAAFTAIALKYGFEERGADDDLNSRNIDFGCTVMPSDGDLLLLTDELLAVTNNLTAGLTTFVRNGDMDEIDEDGEIDLILKEMP